MTSDTSSPHPKRWGVFRVALLASFLLAVATYALEFALSYLLSPYRVDYAVGQYQLYNLLDNSIVFIFNPLIAFLVFYRLSSSSSVGIGAHYVGLVKNCFLGGLVGYSVGYLALVAVNAITTGFDLVAATIGLVDLANLALGMLRGGLDIAFLGFAGVVVGSLRAQGQTSPSAPTPSN